MKTPKEEVHVTLAPSFTTNKSNQICRL